MKQQDFRSAAPMWAALSPLVLWLSMIAAYAYEEDMNLFSWMGRFSQVLERPFAIHWTPHTLKFMLAGLLLYGCGIALYYSSRENRRPGEEYGSAKWGSPKELCKKYMDHTDKNANIILTQKVRLGMNGYVTQRNMNILVVGGSGSGKTRFFCKPGVYSANCSYLITDPKGELLRSSGGLLKAKGYATDKTEHGMRNGTLLAADLSRRMIKRTREKHRETAQGRSAETPLSAPADLPSEVGGESISTNAAEPVGAAPGQTSPTAAESRPTAELPRNVPRSNTKAAPQERGRQKAIQDAKAKKQVQQHLAGKRTAENPIPEKPNGRGKATPPAKRYSVSRQTAAPKNGGVPHKGTPALKTPLSRQSAAVQTSTQYAKAFSQRKAQRKMLQNTVQQGKAAAQKLGGLALQAGKAIGKAVTSAVSSIAALGGGAVVLVLLLTVILVAALVASPFGILFSGESREPGTVPISAAVAQVNYDFDAELQALQTAANYDTITVTGQAADWVEVLAVFAVKVAGADVDATDVAIIDADRIDRLKDVFWDMTSIEHEVEVIHHPGTEDEEGWTERNLYITISAKTAEDTKTVYHFNRNQIAALEELLAQRDLLLELIEDTYAISTDTAKLLRSLPEDLSPEREAVVRTACSLVGKVNYFWGGKSGVIGWDSRWGTLMQVTAAGSPTTGTYRPYGLDCSGFLDWVFNNAHGYVIGHGGGAIMQHRYCTNISWADAQPGDLVFYPEDTHVGIVGGWDEDGNVQIIHCSSSANNVVITGISGFTSIGRPNYFSR